jgi:hypothetical protein
MPPTHPVQQRTRLKNQMHGVLSRNLAATCPHADLSCQRAQLDLPDSWRSVTSHWEPVRSSVDVGAVRRPRLRWRDLFSKIR